MRGALALFGSTSPSYLILQSLDLANPYLETLPERLADFLPRVEALKTRLRAAGWRLVGDEPLKLTISCHSERSEESVPFAADLDGGNGSFDSASLRSGRQRREDGLALAAALEQAGIFCEFADPDYIVFMLSPEHTEEELARLEAALQDAADPGGAGNGPVCRQAGEAAPAPPLPERVCSIRAAMLSPAVTVPAAESLGRVLARPGVSCPPAVPILMPGERIDGAVLAAFARYGIRSVEVLAE